MTLIISGFEVDTIPRLFNVSLHPDHRFKILSQQLAQSSNGLVFRNTPRPYKQEFVRINPKSGQIFLTTKIDREEVCKKAKICQIKIQVNDSDN